MSVDMCKQDTLAAIAKGLQAMQEDLRDPLCKVGREGYEDELAWWRAQEGETVSWRDPGALAQALLDANVLAWEQRYGEKWPGRRDFDESRLAREYTLGETYGAVAIYGNQVGAWLHFHPDSGIRVALDRLTARIAEVALGTLGDPAIGPDSYGAEEVGRSGGVPRVASLGRSPLASDGERWRAMHENYVYSVLQREHVPTAAEVLAAAKGPDVGASTGIPFHVGRPTEGDRRDYGSGWHTYFMVEGQPEPEMIVARPSHLRAAYDWGERAPIPIGGQTAYGELWYDTRLKRAECERFGLVEAPFIERRGMHL